MDKTPDAHEQWRCGLCGVINESLERPCSRCGFPYHAAYDPQIMREHLRRMQLFTRRKWFGVAGVFATCIGLGLVLFVTSGAAFPQWVMTAGWIAAGWCAAIAVAAGIGFYRESR